MMGGGFWNVLLCIVINITTHWHTTGEGNSKVLLQLKRSGCEVREREARPRSGFSHRVIFITFETRLRLLFGLLLMHGSNSERLPT